MSDFEIKRISNPDAVVEKPLGGGGGGFAKATEWKDEFGDSLKINVPVIEAFWYEKDIFKNGEKTGETTPSLMVEIPSPFDDGETSQLMDISPSNRSKIAKALALENPTASGLSDAISNRELEVQVKYYKSFNSWGFVIDIVRAAKVVGVGKRQRADLV